MRRFIVFHGKRHPSELGAQEVAAFLTHLAVERQVAPATQGQAKSAILFLYRMVLKVQLPWLEEVVAARSPRRLPVVLTAQEVRALLDQMSGQVVVRPGQAQVGPWVKSRCLRESSGT